MIPGTTPTFTLVLDDPLQAQDIANVRIDVTQSKSGAEVQKFMSDGGVTVDTVNGTISATLTQEESLQFQKGRAKLQAHVLYTDESAWKTYSSSIKVEESLTDDVITG